MSITAPPPSSAPVEDVVLTAATTDAEVTGDAQRAADLSPFRVGVGTALSTAAAAWMVSGMFRGIAPRLVALLGVLIGAGLFLLASRLRRPSLQYAAIPLAIVVGLVAVAPDARLGTTTFLGLLNQTLHSGGLLQPPIPFEPGWRFILIVLFALLGVAAPSIAVGVNRPRLGVLLPAPLTMGAALVQPQSIEALQVAVALVLIVFGMTLVQSAQLTRGARVGSGFEMNRLGRAAGIAVLMAGLVFGLNTLGFLFPHADSKRVIPPQTPVIQPAPPDTVLFTYTETKTVPVRLGDLDSYSVQQQAWLLPSYDPSRLVRIEPPAPLPQTQKVATTGTITLSITVQNQTGTALPSLINATKITGFPQTMALDPVTDSVALADAPVYTGLAYQVTSPGLPSGDQLSKAPKAPASLAPYLVIPAAPSQVTDLLASFDKHSAAINAPTDPYDCIQYAREQLYAKVVAAGAGNPVAVSAARVGQMLSGTNASPYEIVAAEAMLARWCGVPSRIGYGYYGGTKRPDGTTEVHPRNGAMWLEAYFPGYGWQDLVGVPPHAAASLSSNPTNPISVAAINQLELVVYVAVKNNNPLLLFQYVQWWLVRIAPIVAALALLLATYTWPLKVLRRRKRRRWALQAGIEARIMAAYAEFRDLASDLTIGEPGHTPVGFLDVIDADHEHEELAWLVTRALWGDLRRDLTVDDAVAAETLAASVSRRLDRAQTALDRVLARTARTSLREPYSREVPNIWHNLHISIRRPRRGSRRRRLLVPAGAVASMLLLLVACASAPQTPMRGGKTPPVIPASLVPEKLGQYSFVRETAVESAYTSSGSDSYIDAGRVYAIQRQKGQSDGALEISHFSGVDISDIDDESKALHCTTNPEDCPGHEIFAGLQKATGFGLFTRFYDGSYERAYVMTLTNQRIYMWFPPNTETMVVLILPLEFTKAESDAMVRAILDVEHGKTPAAPPLPTGTQPAQVAPGSSDQQSVNG